MKIKGVRQLRKWWQEWEKYPKVSWGFSILWLLLIAWVAFLWNLGTTGLVDETEPLFAEAARQMKVTGNWITPYFNGETRFDKPPLIYWLMAIGYHLIGVNDWAVRLPSAFAAIFLMGLGFYALRYFGVSHPAALILPENNKKKQQQLWLSAWIGAALIAFNMETLIWSRIGVSDMLLSGCMGGALLCFFIGYASEKTPWYFAFYFLVGLAVLAKGPVGIVLPGLIIFSFLLYLGKLREVLSEMKIFRGIFLVSAIAIPWYILVFLENGSAYIDSFFGYHNFERFTSVVNGHAAPWYFYFLVVLIGFAPWSIYLPVAIGRLLFWRRSFWSQQPRPAQLGIFALFWFATIFIFFTVAITKLPSYVLPLMPAAAILVALLWSEEFSHPILAQGQDEVKKGRSGLWLSSIFNVLFLFLLAAGFFLVPYLLGFDPSVANLPELVADSNLPWRGGIIWTIAGLFCLTFLIRGQKWASIGLTNFIGFAACFVFTIVPASFLLDRVRQLPLRQLSQTIIQVERSGEELWMVGFQKPSVVFYTQKPVKFFKNHDKLREYSNSLNRFPQFSSLLILGESRFIEKIPFRPGDYQLLDRKGTYQLIRVDPLILMQRTRTTN